MGLIGLTKLKKYCEVPQKPSQGGNFGINQFFGRYFILIAQGFSGPGLGLRGTI
jgi:hypothetical protein